MRKKKPPARPTKNKRRKSLKALVSGITPHNLPEVNWGKPMGKEEW